MLPAGNTVAALFLSTVYSPVFPLPTKEMPLHPKMPSGIFDKRGPTMPPIFLYLERSFAHAA